VAEKDLLAPVRKMVADLDLVDGVPQLPQAKLFAWVKKLEAVKSEKALFCEILAVSLRLLEKGHNLAALQFGDLAAIGIYPAMQGRAMRDGGEGLSEAARKAVGNLAFDKPKPGTAAGMSAPKGTSKVGLRVGPKKI
jgi:hypothetical protein